MPRMSFWFARDGAEPFKRYVEEAYPVSTFYGPDGVSVTLPDGYYTDLPYKLAAVASRFGGHLSSVRGPYLEEHEAALERQTEPAPAEEES